MRFSMPCAFFLHFSALSKAVKYKSNEKNDCFVKLRITIRLKYIKKGNNF